MTKARDLADRTAADLTAVTAGTGISITDGAGPIPTVTNTVATGFDAKGDLIVGTGADTFTTLTVGSTAGHVLTVDSATTSGLKWAAPSGGGLVFINKTDYSSANSVSLNNVFTSTYDNYRVILVDNGSAGGTVTFSLRLRVSGSDTNTNYQSQKISAVSTTLSASKNDLGNDEIFLGDGGSSTFPKSPLIFDITTPNIASSTSVMGSAYLSRDVSTSNPLFQIVSGQHTASTSFDGFTIILGNTSTGSVYVYGYAKA